MTFGSVEINLVTFTSITPDVQCQARPSSNKISQPFTHSFCVETARLEEKKILVTGGQLLYFYWLVGVKEHLK